MDWLNVLYYALVAIVTFAGTGIPLITKLWKSYKALNAAKNETEKEKAYNDMLVTAQSLIGAAESAFDGFDKVMKAQGSSAGAMKKDSVLAKLQAYALSNGYDYDASYWSGKVDEIVKFTRDVNAITTTDETASASNTMRVY